MGLQCKAQIADGSVAPDFTLTDINGNSHNLYSYLNQGYDVILDFSATWCVPCWNYHQSHILEDVYDLYGPPGTNEVMVLMIEASPSTTVADIYGTGSNTLGNWVSGTPYPIISSTSLNAAYQLSAFPTILTVCSNGFVYNSGQTNIAGHYNLIDQNCVVASGPVDAEITEYTGVLNSCDDQLELEVELRNLGSNNLTAADMDIIVDGAYINTYNWNGNLPFGTKATIPLGGTAINSSSVVTIDVNVPGDANTSNDQVVFTANIIETSSNEITVNVNLDYYANETSWQLKNSSGAIVASQQYNAAQAGSTQSHSISLPGNDCYSFSILDLYGDGMSYIGNGNNGNFSDYGYNLLDGDGNFLGSHDGDIGYESRSTEFMYNLIPVFDCSFLQLNFGDSCDDGNVNTVNDSVDSNCQCTGTLLWDCTLLQANVNDPCDDGDSNTSNDMVDVNCQCTGTTIDLGFQVRLALEGFMQSNGLMSTDLKSNNLLPVNQPYNSSPYNYNGTESSGFAFPPNTSDWVLLQLRDPNNPASIIDQRAVLLRNDGWLTDLAGNTTLYWPGQNASFLICVQHRSHLGIISSSSLHLQSGLLYDFTTGSNQAMGADQQVFKNGYYALRAGDFDGNGLMNIQDFLMWFGNNTAVNVYLSHDADGTGIVNVLDFLAWFNNRSQVGIPEVQY